MPFDQTARIEKLRVVPLSRKDILSISSGEITLPETMNARTLRPEPGGLFCEKIFGPEESETCACCPRSDKPGRRERCPRCGVEIIDSAARRERFGHIDLSAPVCHVWHYKGADNPISLLTKIPPRALEKIVGQAASLVIATDLALLSEAAKRAESAENPKLAEDIAGLTPGTPVSETFRSVLESAAPGGTLMESGADAVRSALRSLNLPRIAEEERQRVSGGKLSPIETERAVRRAKLAESLI